MGSLLLYASGFRLYYVRAVLKHARSKFGGVTELGMLLTEWSGVIYNRSRPTQVTFCTDAVCS